MSVDLIQQRLELATPESAQRQEQMLKEIFQEIALAALSQARFFEQAAFHGGTSLRILYKLRRFSEDLDFLLKEPNTDFSWDKYAAALMTEFALFGVDLEIQDRSKVPSAIKTIFLKHGSVGKLLTLHYPMHPKKKLLVKLEIDSNPPAGSTFEIQHLNFPTPFSVLVQAQDCQMANKLHALLCRAYTKGRDWFDFLWYLDRHIKPNLKLLQNALIQQGPWADQDLQIDLDWLLSAFDEKIQNCDWEVAKRDIDRFLGKLEQRGLESWGKEFFLSQLTRLQDLFAVDPLIKS
ncbi:MAG: nucleotidyl transferase AbiEii/AbiGii toxin family protein [Deltaproteobacteria bacterium]|nr:nucleotidyl transferase AbiEii/AbiGii toxin family protein [Deltaproteobacteria bacterium]